MTGHSHRGLLTWLPPLLVAAATTAAILCAVAPRPANGRSWGCPAPGITLDEAFDVQQGVRLAKGIPEWIAGNLSTADLWSESPRAATRGLHRRPLFGYHLPDHPPLGRLWLGIAHELSARASAASGESPPFVTAAARTGSAVAFGLTVLLIGWVTARWYGPLAGFAAALALVTMPRLFGHAHLAALETVMDLAFVAALLSAAALWGDKPPGWKTAAFTGVLFGLALLTKIQAVLLPVPVALWAVWRYRTRAIVPLAIWGSVALVVFFVGWPWLWFDPAGHLMQYFGRTTGRVTLKVFYFGTVYADRETPWHYPFVMFLLTVPVGWLLLGGLGIGGRRAKQSGRPKAESGQAATRHSPLTLHAQTTDWRRRLLIGAALFPLLVFAVPGVVVYDGVRLFLVTFPVWAVFAGRGTAIAAETLKRRWGRRCSAGVIAAVILAQFAGVVLLRPCYLSYYNALAGGLWGAEKLGLEPTYWGDSVTPEFCDEVAAELPPGETVQLSPVLDASYPLELRAQSPAFRAKDIRFAPYDPARFKRSRYVLMFRRRADLFAELEPVPAGAKLRAAVRRQGVVLAALYEFPR